MFLNSKLSNSELYPELFPATKTFIIMAIRVLIELLKDIALPGEFELIHVVLHN